MKPAINPNLWSMFCFFNEGMYNGKINERDLVVSSTAHAYQPITFIDVLVKNVDNYMVDGKLPKCFKLMVKFPSGEQGFRYAIYNSALENTQEGLSHIASLLNKNINETNSAVSPILTGIRTVLATPYFDSEGVRVGSKKRPKGYIPGYNAFVNRIQYIPTVQEVEAVANSASFNEWVELINTNAFNLAERQFNKIGKRIPDILKQIAHISSGWALKTKRQKTYDLYLSVDLDTTTRQVYLGIDVAKPITDNDEPFSINRSRFNPEEWFSGEELELWYYKHPLNEATQETHDICIDGKTLLDFKPSEDFIHVEKLMKQIKEFNLVIDRYNTLLNNSKGMISEFLKDLFRVNIQAPIIRSANQIWKFSDICEQGRLMVDKTASEIIDILVKLEKEKGQRVYLDVTNFLLHTKGEDGNSEPLADNEQEVNSMFMHFMASYGQGVQAALFRTQSPYLAPFAVTRPADLSAANDVPTINAEDLLGKENELRK